MSQTTEDQSQSQEFDYVVIGGGSGGLASARRAASYGARVALIERSALGGTCVNVGCVPKKIMFLAASLADALHHAKEYCVIKEEVTPELDWSAMKQKRDAYITRLNGIYGSNLEKDKVRVFQGDATLLSKNTVLIRDTQQQLTAKHILLAPGGHPLLPPASFQGRHLLSTSNDFFEWDAKPRRVAVVGAGYIAVEMAGILRALGVDVQLFVRGDRPLRNFDPIVTDVLVEELSKAGIGLHAHTNVTAVTDESAEQGQRNITLHYTQNGAAQQMKDFSHVLYAIGRAPNTAGLNLEALGVATTSTGLIQVDEYQNTNIPNIYAVGDVVGRVELTPVAIAAGRQLSERLFNGKSSAKISYEQVPTVVFSHPPIGTCGLTEKQAVDKYGYEAVTIYKTRFTNMYFSMLTKKQPTAMKLVCVGPEERVVGVHIIGLGADEMLQGFGVAIKAGLTKRQWDDCIAIHPTAAEELVTMRGGQPAAKL